ncbi:uncharacterized protein CC84DRAFT_1212271 [Paraphaeosphaeria sporulosa]|uniref:Uncharacterized protein n=1 Tax=Paraphaeosphaeria sporulosa TaxID=1460663 RepID=A0A177D074_9PLEO|nr:uncharacterized protein CC84DRAFT_1212271 [Paraphaeosphaeria sporulosa]OAG12768.1 hypothetical protein CC84DRAFT_1212271 [Paraphaeosphaeria sporulosa]
MRFFTFLPALAPLCGLAASAAVSAAGSGVQKLFERSQLALQAPKLHRAPEGHIQRKRDAEQMFTFGGYASNLTGDGNYLKLEEPIEANGHPHPWCQGFEGSNGYTEGQEPTIHYVHMDKAKNESDPPGIPQYICWFYNDFDCDPTKGAVGSFKFTHTHLTDLDKKDKNGDDSNTNRDFPLMSGGANRFEWIKAYGCMFYVDNPSANEDSGNDVGQAGIAQDGTTGTELSAAELEAGQMIRALAK